MTYQSKIKIKTLFTVSLLLVIGWRAFSGNLEDRISYPFTRLSALGGYHAALADDMSVIFNNPAGFQNVGTLMHCSELTLHAAGPIFDITGMLIEALNGGDITTELMSSGILQGLYADIELAGPLSFAYIDHGIAFGIFNWADMNIQESSAVSYSARARENILFGGGYAFRIPLPEKTRSQLDIGFFTKMLFQGALFTEKDMLGLVSIINNPTSLIFEEPFHFTFAIGVDAGIRYSINDIISFGLVCRDAYTHAFSFNYSSINGLRGDEEPVATNSQVPLDLATGVVFSPRLRILSRWISTLKFMLDYNDILAPVTHPDTVKHWFLNLSYGMEVELMDVLSLQFGFSQGLFTSGLALDLALFRFYLAMYGTEASIEPGLKPVYNIALGFYFAY
jgi:hypothetical protein